MKETGVLLWLQSIEIEMDGISPIGARWMETFEDATEAMEQLYTAGARRVAVAEEHLTTICSDSPLPYTKDIIIYLPPQNEDDLKQLLYHIATALHPHSIKEIDALTIHLSWE